MSILYCFAIVVCLIGIWYAAVRFFIWIECPDKGERTARERTTQAQKRKIGIKACEVAMTLGNREEEVNGEERAWRYHDPEIQIESIVASSFQLWIWIVRYRGERVFQGMAFYDRRVESYIPGDWEMMLERLYVKAMQVNAAKKSREESDEREQRKKNFGL